PPILIEIQRQIDQDFMIRLVHFCTCVYKRYRILPVVLIIVLDDFTDDLLKEGLLDSDSFGFNNDNEFLVKIQSTCWAKECFSITKNSITQHVNNGKPMSPLLLLSKHMIQQQSDLLTVNRDEEIAV
ncbi:hypothetical protein BDF20DRAFT_804410, partial [Mycotypha africana]|uniref:uncharacterized protein n=1 Tax=Mycotypha africana TaxID=64632 RepID=UPI002300E6C2